jgi:hypothetical protein
MKIKLKEKDTQKTILKYLEAKRIFHYRNNSGALKTEKGGFVRFGATGSPDIICVINGQFVGIEVKSTGGVHSKGQIKFQKALVDAGGCYILAHTPEDVTEII